MEEVEIPYRHFVDVRPRQNVSSEASFTNEIIIEYDANNDDEIDINSSIVAVDVSVKKSTLDGVTACQWNLGNGEAVATQCPTADGVEGTDTLSDNPFSCLFKSQSLELMNTPVDNINNLAQESTIYDLCFMSREEGLASSSPIVIEDYVSDVITTYEADAHYENGAFAHKTGTTATGVNLAGVKFLNGRMLADLERVYRVTEVQKQLRFVAAGTEVTFKLAHSLRPMANLIDDSKIIGGKYRLRLTPDANFKQKLLVFYSSSTGPLDYGAVAPGGSVSFKNLRWLIPVNKRKDGLPMQLSTSHLMLASRSYSYAYASGETYNISADSAGVKYVMVSFGRVTPTYDGNYNSFMGPFSYDAQKLQSLYITYASRQYPTPQYNFVNDVDIQRAYNDYLEFTNVKKLGVSPMMTYREWRQNPVFVFYTEPERGNGSRALSVVANGSSVGANSMVGRGYHIMITTFHDRMLQIGYDDYGQMNSVAVSNTF